MKKRFKDLKVGDTIYIVERPPRIRITPEKVGRVKKENGGYITFGYTEHNYAEFVDCEAISCRNVFFVNYEDALARLEEKIYCKIGEYESEISLLKKELSEAKRKL